MQLKKFTRYPKLLVVLVLLLVQQIKAQTPTDVVMMPAGSMCVDVTYEYSQWTKYWEGTLLRTNGNVGTLQKHSVSPMVDLGILKWLDVLASVHYVVTHPTRGQLAGAHGFSDFNLWVKALPLDKKLGPGKIDLAFTAGFAIPVSRYVADYPYSIGMGCPEGSLRAVLQYKFTNGIYFGAETGYMQRGYTILQRNYYFTNQGYFNDQVLIPNAMDYRGFVGYFTKDEQFKVELFTDGIKTFGGFDIRKQDAPFPSNTVNYTRIGGSFNYNPKFVKGLGGHLMGGYVLTGRNMGQTASIDVGISYAFGIWTPGAKKAAKAKAQSAPQK